MTPGPLECDRHGQSELGQKRKVVGTTLFRSVRSYRRVGFDRLSQLYMNARREFLPLMSELGSLYRLQKDDG